MRAIGILRLLLFLAVFLRTSGEEGDTNDCPDTGGGECRRLPACPRMEKGMATVRAGWEIALNEWDAKAQAVYLEWEVRGAGDAHECMCDDNEVGRVEKNWVAEVVVDGTVVAEQSHEEAGAVVGGLSLGRHIGLVILKDVCTSTVVDKEKSEFQLHFHTHLVITEPAQRAVLTPDEPFLVCVGLLLSALCIDILDGGGGGDDAAPKTGCQTSGDVTVLVDGSPVANISDVSMTDRGCAFISPFSGPVPRHGKVFAITAEMQAKGTPISKLHHVSLPGEFGFNAEWMSRKASLSAEGLIQDAVISAQALEGGGYINPCVYRSGTGWRVTFRRHHIRKTEAEDEEILRYNANLIEPSLQYDAAIHRRPAGSWELGLDPPPALLDLVIGDAAPSIEGARGPQDARVVHGGQEPIFWFNGNSRRWPSRVTQQAHTRSKGTLEILLSKKVVEKNFVAWRGDGGTLLFAYSIEPHEVYRLDEAGGEATLQASTTNEVLSSSIARGDVWLHGGSSALHVVRRGQPELLSVCHTKLPDTSEYKTYAYTFSRDEPYGIRGWSKPLPLQGRIQMAMGAELAKRSADGSLAPDPQGGEILVVSYGRDDEEMRVAELDLKAVLDGMEDIAQVLPAT